MYNPSYTLCGHIKMTRPPHSKLNNEQKRLENNESQQNSRQVSLNPTFSSKLMPYSRKKNLFCHPRLWRPVFTASEKHICCSEPDGQRLRSATLSGLHACGPHFPLSTNGPDRKHRFFNKVVKGNK